MKHVRELQHNGLLWLNVTKQGEKELAGLEKRFGFLKADVKESLPPFQRPKIVKRDTYYFIVLHFPVFDRETRRMGFTEVDIFLSASYLVTIHDNHLSAIENFFLECSKEPGRLSQYFDGTTAHLFFEVLTRLIESIFPILLHVNEDINEVDKQLFVSQLDRKIAEEILRLKTNIVTFRRTMQGHRMVLDRLVMYGDRDLNLTHYQTYITTLREAVTEIWHMLESQKESINALHETNESILSLRTNQVMKTLTIISVITFPLTLIATLFSINANGTPFIHDPLGFWTIVAIIGCGIIAMLTVFKLKRWM